MMYVCMYTDMYVSTRVVGKLQNSCIELYSVSTLGTRSSKYLKS